MERVLLRVTYYNTFKKNIWRVENFFSPICGVGGDAGFCCVEVEGKYFYDDLWPKPNYEDGYSTANERLPNVVDNVVVGDGDSLVNDLDVREQHN